jgi:putative adhesin
MNRATYRVYLPAALALLTLGCVMGERRVDTITRSWPADGIKRVDVNGIDGSVDVTAGSTNEIALVAHVRTRDFKPDLKKENKGYFVTSVDGDTLTIGRQHGVHVHSPFFFFSSEDVEISYELRVPPSLDLELKTVNGRVATRGTDGEIQATTVNGSVDVETTGTREVSLHTINGPLEARFTKDFQGAHFKTVNGGVRAVLPATASFACVLSQVNGDFEAAFPLTIHSHPGSRRVSGEVNGGRHDLNIVTVNGDIKIENAPAAPAVPAAPAPPPPPAPSTE